MGNDVKQPTNKADRIPRRHRWKPGESGNPNGRPKKEDCITSLMKEFLECEVERDGQILLNKDGTPKTYKKLFAEAMIKMGINGNRTAMNIVLERVEGKVPLKLEHSGLDETIVEMNKDREATNKILKDPELAQKAVDIVRVLYGDK